MFNKLYDFLHIVLWLKLGKTTAAQLIEILYKISKLLGRFHHFQERIQCSQENLCLIGINYKYFIMMP